MEMDTSVNKKIAIIGVGHLGRALARSFLNPMGGRNKLILATPHVTHLTDLQKKYSVEITSDNKLAAIKADIVILAVRPRVIKIVVEEIREHITKETIIISTAACVPLQLLDKYFQSEKVKVVRIMPNIPVAYSMGVIGWLANNNLSENEKKIITILLSPLGLLIDCNNDEELDKLGMISGCGPGYIAYFMNNLEKVAISYGFSAKQAKAIVEQTFAGTLKHLKETQLSTKDLVSAVATKGGITEEVIGNFNKNNFSVLLKESIDHGYKKVRKISRELKIIV